MFGWFKRKPKLIDQHFEFPFEKLVERFNHAQKICPPDEYDLRQRKLLYDLTLYVIARDAPKQKVDNDDLDADRVAASGCCARTETGASPRSCNRADA